VKEFTSVERETRTLARKDGVPCALLLLVASCLLAWGCGGRAPVAAGQETTRALQDAHAADAAHADADRPTEVPYPGLLRECVKRVFVRFDGSDAAFPRPRNGVFFEAAQGLGDVLLPYLQEMADGDTGGYGSAAGLYFQYLLSDCTPPKCTGVLTTLARKYPDNAMFRVLLVKAGNYWRFESVFRHSRWLRPTIRKDPGLRAYVDGWLEAKRGTPEYEREFKVFMSLERTPAAAHHDRIREENRAAIRKLAGTGELWTEDQRAFFQNASANIDILAAIQDERSLAELEAILDSGNSHIQNYVVTRLGKLTGADRRRFVGRLAKIARSPVEFTYGCLSDPSSNACMMLITIDRTEAKRIIEPLLDNPSGVVIESAAGALAYSIPPLITLDELKQHLATTANPRALEKTIRLLAILRLGPEAERRMAMEGMIRPPEGRSLDVKAARGPLVRFLKARDEEVLASLWRFMVWGETAYTERYNPARYKVYDAYFRNLWHYTESLAEAYPDCPRYPRWFWLCAGEGEKAKAKEELLRYVKRLLDPSGRARPQAATEGKE
jgi:hypothetical protein